MNSSAAALHLRHGGTSVVIDTTPEFPAIVYWGESLGQASTAEVESLARAARNQRVSGYLDRGVTLSLLPQASTGWFGTPGLEGSRAGRSFAPAVVTSGIDANETSATIRGTDAAAGLAVTVTLDLDAAGILRTTVALTNTASDDYELAALRATLPVPVSAREVMDTTGRHLRERHPQRYPFTIGRHERDSRRGRPGADAPLLVLAGTPGFGFESGLVHGIHLAWSGNFQLAAERTGNGLALLQAGELLLPGEVRLAPGESYRTPVVIGAWGEGLNALSASLHDSVRSRPQHPRSPRPVTLNTWEAMYFDLDTERLRTLADAAAAVGVERFVLDDGWFLGRRDDTAGLGDWYVDPAVFPEGLGPIIRHVTGLGMEFGLWVEPEMINPDSELARAHPDWILQPEGRLPIEGRGQHVLDLSHPDAYAYLSERLHALLDENDIAYLKWDHNRDLVDPGSTVTGAAAVHANVEALYRLLDGLKEAHPGLEIESCASGGARVDLGIADRTDRFWTSDCIDPIERLGIQKYTSLLVPYEMLGAHISGPESHSTGRTSRLALRGATALFGHLGIEWNVTTASPDDLAQLTRWVEFHKAHRELLHSGHAVYADLPDDSVDLRGVVAGERDRALYVFTQVGSSNAYPGDAITLPGLDDDTVYEVSLSDVTERDGFNGQSPLPWLDAPLRMSGRALRRAGLRPPVLFPESAVVLLVTAVG